MTPPKPGDKQPEDLESVAGAAAASGSFVDRRNAQALAGLRIAVGVLFLIFAQYKVFGAEFTRGGGFPLWVNRFLADGTYPFMAPMLRDFVLPHAKFCAYLVAYGELAIGLALVLGVMVRTASAFGLAYMLALLFSSNYPGAHAAFWQYFGASLDHSVLLLCFATFVFGNSDQVLALRRATRDGRTRAEEKHPL